MKNIYRTRDVVVISSTNINVYTSWSIIVWEYKLWYDPAIKINGNDLFSSSGVPSLFLYFSFIFLSHPILAQKSINNLTLYYDFYHELSNFIVCLFVLLNEWDRDGRWYSFRLTNQLTYYYYRTVSNSKCIIF